MKLFILCFLVSVGLGQLEATAGESIYGINIKCQFMEHHALGDDAFSNQTRKTMADAVAQNDWPLMRGMIWLGADPDMARASPWYDAAKRERLNADLVEAAAAGDDETVLAALQRGGDASFQADLLEYMSPLMWAAGCDHLSTVDILIAHGANVNVGSRYDNGEAWAVEGSTPLIWAAEYANDAIVELLLSKGADVNAQELTIHDAQKAPDKKDKWDTALLASGSLATTEILLRHNADPNIVRSDGTSPLMLAASHGNDAQCKLLLEHGASPGLKNTDGSTASDLAREYKHAGVAAMIDQWPARTARP
jgi:ankyrin repeat protein